MQFDRIISVRNNRTVFRDGELCIKVLEDDFPASFVLSEATNMVAAAEAGLNVPSCVKSICTAANASLPMTISLEVRFCAATGMMLISARSG